MQRPRRPHRGHHGTITAGKKGDVNSSQLDSVLQNYSPSQNVALFGNMAISGVISYMGRVGFLCNITGAFLRRGRDTDRHVGRRPGDSGGTDWSDLSTSQGAPGFSHRQELREREGGTVAWSPQRKQGPAGAVISDSGPRSGNTFLLLRLPSWCDLLLHPRKLVHQS